MSAPFIHQAIHHFAYPIVQSTTSVDLPAPVDPTLPWLGYQYLTLAPGSYTQQPITGRLDILFQLRSLRLVCWDRAGNFFQPNGIAQWLDLIDIQLFSDDLCGSTKLTDVMRGSLFGTSAPGMGQLNLKHYLDHRFSLTMCITNNNPGRETLYLGGHLWGMAFRREEMKA